jgi:hypothetical protein
MAEAWLRRSKQLRKVALPVSHLGISVPQGFWMQLHLIKAETVKPPIYDEKISFLWLKRVRE